MHIQYMFHYVVHTYMHTLTHTHTHTHTYTHKHTHTHRLHCSTLPIKVRGGCVSTTLLSTVLQSSKTSIAAVRLMQSSTTSLRAVSLLIIYLFNEAFSPIGIQYSRTSLIRTALYLGAERCVRIDEFVRISEIRVQYVHACA